LEERTFEFAKKVTEFTRKLENNPSNREYARQLIRSSGSVGANYIEANEALSKRDFAHRIRIARKEAKESAYWIRLIKETNTELVQQESVRLFDEAIELKKILSAILVKVS